MKILWISDLKSTNPGFQCEYKSLWEDQAFLSKTFFPWHCCALMSSPRAATSVATKVRMLPDLNWPSAKSRSRWSFFHTTEQRDQNKVGVVSMGAVGCRTLKGTLIHLEWWPSIGIWTRWNFLSKDASKNRRAHRSWCWKGIWCREMSQQIYKQSSLFSSNQISGATVGCRIVELHALYLRESVRDLSDIPVLVAIGSPCYWVSARETTSP